MILKWRSAVHVHVTLTSLLTGWGGTLSPGMHVLVGSGSGVRQVRGMFQFETATVGKVKSGLQRVGQRLQACHAEIIGEAEALNPETKALQRPKGMEELADRRPLKYSQCRLAPANESQDPSQRPCVPAS